MAKKHLWLARDPHEKAAYSLYLSSKPPKEIPSFSWIDGPDWEFDYSYIYKFCKKDFERLNKFRLKPGEYARVKINIELDW